VRDYIRNEDGSIRNCISNYAKMGVLRLMRFDRRSLLRDYREAFVQIGVGLCGVLNLLLLLPLYPLRTWFSRRRAQRLLRGRRP